MPYLNSRVNLLDKLSDETFVEFGDFGLLTFDEVLQLSDAFLCLLAACDFCSRSVKISAAMAL